MTISELTDRLKASIEPTFRSIAIRGEISGFRGRHGASGHLYFTLKDKASQIPAVMWASSAERMRFTPEEGMEVTAIGSVEIYKPRGSYQFIIQRMEPLGVGDLQVAFRQMCERLKAEGLFEAARKREVPLHARRIGIVTAPTGAVIRDMWSIMHRRDPRVSVVLYPCRVQGEGAKEEIAAGIGYLNRKREELGLEVLIVGRGGGSLEDLWAFNEEVVARAIAASELPVVSAVGHETDTTIADFVADRRAATPSEAAELLTQRLDDLVAGVEETESRLHAAVRGMILGLGQELDQYSARLEAQAPRRRLAQTREVLESLGGRLDLSVRRTLRQGSERVEALASRLESLSPLAVLSRGYAVALDAEGAVIRSAAAVKPGQQFSVRVVDGRIEGLVVRGVVGE
jgi:exodeoxyribonuclease VII large subunit